MNTPRLLPIALATPRTNFLGPPAVRCELGLDREKKCSKSGDDRATVYSRYNTTPDGFDASSHEPVELLM